MATLTVGINRQYATIAAALAAARTGDTVAVAAGTYVNDFATIRTRVNLIAVGGQVTMLATRSLASGGAILTVSADAVIDGFVIAGATTPDGTAAGLLYTAGALTLRNSLVTNNQTGLLALGSATGTILIQGSEFAGNGAGDGFTPNLAVGAVKSLTIQNSYIHDAVGGAEIRSRAKATTITGTRIQDNATAGTVSLDLPNGGVTTVQDTVFQKGAGSGPVVVRDGGDAAYAGSSLTMLRVTVVADRPNAVLVQNQTPGSATVTGASVWGGPSLSGPVTVSGLLATGTRPAVSVAPLVAPAFALPVEPGRAGAVVANGTVRLVGAGGEYATLSAAIAAAQDGDTIRVAAGTYRDDAVVVTKALIIESSGGIAQFVLTRPPANGQAWLVARADLTLRGIEVTGVAIPGGVGTAVLAQSGRLTLVNSVLHDNQAGLVATGVTADSVAVYDSEIARNGTADGRGGNVDVGAVGSFVMRNVWVHDGQAAAEVRSRADNTVLDADRITQQRGTGAAGLELPSGGRVTINGSVIEKGPFAQSTPLIHVGGSTAGSQVTVTGTTLLGASSLATAVVAETGAASLSLSGTQVRTGVTATNTAPWSASGGVTPDALLADQTTPAAQRGVLSLRIAGDAWRGEPMFTLAVDGTVVGGPQKASAAHAAGQSQAFTIVGDFAPGPHSVTVRFINDLGGADGGRALYLDGASFNGKSFGGPVVLASNGSATIATAAAPRTTPVTLSLSETTPGSAPVLIAIDGTVLGGVQSVSDATPMRFLLDLQPGAHTVSVAALDAARPVALDWIDVAGDRYAGSAGVAQTAGHFAFTVAPPPAANAGLFLTAGLPELLVPV